jgi:hypothetical protein
MFRPASLFCLLLSLLSTTTPTWSQKESQPNAIRILVEGEPLLSLSFIEAMRRINARYDLKFEFVDGPDARHDLRLIVTGGNGRASCSEGSSSYSYNSVVALAPNGKMLFTVERSSDSGKVVEDAATVAIKHIYTQSNLPQNQSPSNTAAPQETAKLIEPAVQEPPAEPGIYYRSGVDWVMLAPSSGRLDTKRAGFTGFRTAKVYDGVHAKPQAAELKPEFYVRGFPVSEKEIRIVRLETKPDHREIQIDPANLKRHTYSIYRPNDIHAVTVTRVSNRVYKITPASDLQPGEYALILYTSYSKDGNYSEDGEYEFGITMSIK